MLLGRPFVQSIWLLVAGTAVIVDATPRPQDTDPGTENTTVGSAFTLPQAGSPHTKTSQIRRHFTLADILSANELDSLRALPRNKPSTLRLVHGGLTEAFGTRLSLDTSTDESPQTSQKRDIHLDDQTCPDSGWRDMLSHERDGALTMIAHANTINATHPIWNALIEKDQANKPGVLKLFQNRLQGLSDRIADDSRPIKLRCDQRNNATACTNTYTGTADTISWSNPPASEILVCNAISQSQNFTGMACVKKQSIADYDSIATSIIHESIHVVWQNDPNLFVRDIEYGWDDCVALAKGEYKDISKGATLVNVDTMALLISDGYWYDKCRDEKLTPNLDYCCLTCSCRKP